jgi:AraC-like DNA-binding protein
VSEAAGERLKVSSAPKMNELIRSWMELTDASLLLGTKLADGQLARQFEARILEVLLTNVTRPGREPGISERRQIAHRARQYMVLNMDEPMTIVDICRAVRAAERTLHLGFRECFGMTPKKFLKLLRLNADRRSLQRPEAGTTVTDVALRWVFFHLARFAGDYRQLFYRVAFGNAATRRRHCLDAFCRWPISGVVPCPFGHFSHVPRAVNYTVRDLFFDPATMARQL